MFPIHSIKSYRRNFQSRYDLISPHHGDSVLLWCFPDFCIHECCIFMKYVERLPSKNLWTGQSQSQIDNCYFVFNSCISQDQIWEHFFVIFSILFDIFISYTIWNVKKMVSPAWSYYSLAWSHLLPLSSLFPCLRSHCSLGWRYIWPMLFGNWIWQFGG